MTAQKFDPIQLTAIIIGLNVETTLSQCIHSVKQSCQVAQDEMEVETEIVYVDSSSSDASRQIAAGEGLTTYLANPAYRSAPNGRTSGFLLTGGEFVMFVDGDMVLAPTWMVDGLRFLAEHERAGGVGGICDAIRQVGDRQVRNENYYHIKKEVAPAREGGTFLFRRTALDAVGAYEPELVAGAEYYLLCALRRAGWPLYRIRRPMLTHLDQHLRDQASRKRKLATLVFRSSLWQAALIRQALFRLGCPEIFSFYRFEFVHLLVLLGSLAALLVAFFQPALRLPILIALGLLWLLYSIFQVWRKGSLSLGLAALGLLSAYAAAIIWVGVAGRPKPHLGIQTLSDYVEGLRAANQ